MKGGVAAFRNATMPALPELLKDVNDLEFVRSEERQVEPGISLLFPHLKDTSVYKVMRGTTEARRPLKVGVLFSGGPAAGGHNVILGIAEALFQMHSESKLYGFLKGPAGLISGKKVELDLEALLPYRNMGGFDLLGTGRTKIESEEQFASCLKAAQDLDLDGIVIIGGDDSNTNAAYLADYFLSRESKCVVVGVPKTIDGDLKNRDIEVSFGFDSASKTYSELVGNICRDAASQGKYYFFIKVMGRSASHLVLECALQAHPNMTLISEEVQANGESLKQVVSRIADLIIARANCGLYYGVILIPEGLIEFIPDLKRVLNEIGKEGEPVSAEGKAVWELLPKDLREQLLLDKDPHGNIQVSKIETERLLIALVSREIKDRLGDEPFAFSTQPLFFGYEGRSCLPTLFDANYCYSLGVAAALLIKHKMTGFMATIKGLTNPIDDWQVFAVPLLTMMGLEERKGVMKAVIQKGLVDLQGAPYKEFKKLEKSMQEKDLYRDPGPIQFFGPNSLSESTTFTLSLESGSKK